MDAEQLPHVELPRTKCRAKRAIRRAYQHHQACCVCSMQPAQGRGNQTPFVLARLGLQYLRHGAARPAAAGQNKIQRGVTRGNSLHTGPARMTQLARTPDMGNVNID